MALSTSKDGGPPIVLYEYQPSWEAKHAAKFQDGFSGYLHITFMSRSADSIQHCGSLWGWLICRLLYGFTSVVHTGFVFQKPIPQARRRMSREAPADRAGSTTGVTLITRRETLSPLCSGTRIVPEKWFAASCEVMTEALLISLLITI